MSGKLSNELQKFYVALNTKNITKSKLYYRTIINLLNSEANFIEIEDLEDILKKETILIENYNHTKSLVEYICTFYDLVSKKQIEEAYNCANTIYSIIESDNYQITNLEFQQYLKNEVDKLEISEKVKDSIDKAYYYGMSLIEDINNNDLPLINNVIDEIPNTKLVVANETTVAITNKLEKREKVDSRELYAQANKLYFERNYKESLDILLVLLRNHKIKANVYGKIGLCYMKLGLTDIAIEYLKLATLLNTDKNPKYDYTDLIFKLHNKVDDNDKNIKFKVLEEEFKDSIDDYYGVDTINDVVYLVNKGYSIENASFMLNLSDEQINLVYLIYARECYINKDYRNGDGYLTKVLKNENKTAYAIEKMKNINLNKNYYCNRRIINDRPAILKLNK